MGEHSLTRRSFLTHTAATAATLAVGAAATAQLAQAAGGPPGAPKPGLVMVPMKVDWQRGWLSWVSATAACLRALGVECDQTDVAGLSGYAFVLNCDPVVDVSCPTAFDWSLLTGGVQLLGRSTQEFFARDAPNSDKAFGDLRVLGERAAYEMVAREIAEGRPCVVWGYPEPEFVPAIGAGDGAYQFALPQPPVKYGDLKDPGGAYALAFPTATVASPEARDSYALCNAVRLLTGRSVIPDYAFGLAAYDVWIAAVEADKSAAFGLAYTTQCFAEGRRYAHDFLDRMMLRQPAIAEPLGRAVAAYRAAADAMGGLAGLFPFPTGEQMGDPAAQKAWNDQIRAAATREKGVALLREAKAAETRALAALIEAADYWKGRLWRK